MKHLKCSRGMLDDLGLGVIDRLLQPGFFIGVISNREQAVDEALLPEGQFLYGLQHNGESCTNAYLRGIFFPLRSAIEGESRQALYRIAAKFGGWSGFEVQDYSSLAAEWGVLGAPSIEKIDPQGKGSSEALLRFPPDELLEWLRPFACYAQEFSGIDPESLSPSSLDITQEEVDKLMPNWPPPRETWPEKLGASVIHMRCQDSWRISRTGRIPWKSIEEFADWMSVGGRAPLRSTFLGPGTNRLEAAEPKIDAAFYYPNKGRMFEAP